MKFFTRITLICTVLAIVCKNSTVNGNSVSKGETLLELLHAVEDALDEISASCEIPMPVTKFVAVCRQIEKLIRKIKFRRKVLPKIRYLCEKLDLMLSDIRKRINMGEIRANMGIFEATTESVLKNTAFKLNSHHKVLDLWTCIKSIFGNSCQILRKMFISRFNDIPQ